MKAMVIQGVGQPFKKEEREFPQTGRDGVLIYEE